MAKSSSQYICQSCGAIHAKWAGKCEDCGQWSTLAEELVEAAPKAMTPGKKGRQVEFVALDGKNQPEERLQTGLGELDRVLGGGLVAGSAILIGGDPGIGKSTLLLQLVARLGQAGVSAAYISGEESAAQIQLRASRLGLGGQGVRLATANSVRDIVASLDGRMNKDDLWVNLIAMKIQTTRESMSPRSKRPKASQLKMYADQGLRLPMTISVSPLESGDYKLVATANLSQLRNPLTVQNFYKDLNLRLGGRFFRFSGDHSTRVYQCEQTVSKQELEQNFELIYKDQVLDRGRFNTESGKFSSELSDLHRLLVFEIRGLSRQKTDGYPGDRKKIEGLVAKQHSPLTDLHTHLTAQISAKDLIQVAREHDALYPVELLRDKLGIDEASLPKDRHEMPSCEFVPTSGEGLACEKAGQMVEGVKVRDLSAKVLARLEYALATPIDSIYTFDEIERKMYRFRNPFTKNDQLIEPVILKVAETYKKEGVTYTEQAVTGTSNPKWLEKALPALEKAKQDYGVDMRFLVGIPRTFPPERMLNEIQKLKHVAQSPHIVGVDFLGYEANKTQNFHWALTQLAQWVSAQKADPKTGHLFDDFVLRVHAGETGKNLDNVYEAMQVANRFNVRLRIGHGIHIDMDEDFKKLAREMATKGLIAVEFNPDSNIALNNIDFPTDIPVKRWQDLGVPCVLSTDGAGAYQSTQIQTAQNMLYAGMSLEDLEKVRTLETTYIADQQTRFAAKSEYFNSLYAGGNKEFIDSYKKLCEDLARRSIRGQLPEDLKAKTPLLIAGASGSSWSMVDDADQIEAEVGMQMLVKLLDPQKAYFAVGRIKDEGITHLLDQSISEHHDGRPADASHFGLIGLLSEIQNMPRLPENLSHIWPLKGGLMSVPHEMVNFLHQQEPKGHAIFIGGGAFTRDFIHHCEKLQVPFGLMDGPKGASTDKARAYDKNHVFKGAIGLIEHLLEKQPQIFRSDIKIGRDYLKHMYDEIYAQVDEERYPEEAKAMQKSWMERAAGKGATSKER